MADYFWSFVRFAILSLLSFALTLGLTVLSVQVFGWNPVFAHILTLLIVMAVNAWFLIVFVFPSDGMNRRRFVKAYVCSTFILRSAEWCLFALSVEWLGWDYRWSIILINPIFVLIKFLFLKGRAHSNQP